MSVQEQLHDQTWAMTSDYSEIKPFIGDERYLVTNTFHSNGLFDKYYVGLK